jgi:hypothetical protein
MPEYLERVKFYADTPAGDVNKLFTFETNIFSIERLFRTFIIQKKYNIRAAWYEKIDKDTGEIVENTRLDLHIYLPSKKI